MGSHEKESYQERSGQLMSNATNRSSKVRIGTSPPELVTLRSLVTSTRAILGKDGDKSHHWSKHKRNEKRSKDC